MNPSIFNTLTRKREQLIPQSPAEPFKMYCCGPTVYGPAHIGNFRTFAVQDVLRRTLEASGLKVIHVRNITDVDDKTIRESRRQGLTLKDFTRKWEEKFHIDCERLNMLKPTVEPRATEHIAQQLKMVETLIQKGHAYAAEDGSVYFKISSFPDYGKLSGLDKDNLKTQSVNSAGDANAADEYERESVADFALWKGRKSEDGDNFWKSPWGEGRPGWHIECSAMSEEYLGTTFDLHGGGIDLCFPHHENEIAQSRCASGAPQSVRYWFHSAHLMVEGQKMSKSLGNLYTLDDLLQKGYTAREVRFALISGHYRQQLNFTFKGLEDARSAIAKLEKGAGALLDALKIPHENFAEFARAGFNPAGTAFAPAWDALCEDLNVPRALGELFAALGRKDAAYTLEDLKALGVLMYALGLNLFEKPVSAHDEEAPAEIKALAQARWQAKQNRNFAEADSLRKSLSDKGWLILDRKDGYDLKKA